MRRGFSIASRCRCCDNAESLRHIFFDGVAVQQVWSHYARMVGLQYTTSTCLSTTLMSWFLAVSSGRTDHLICAIPLVILWFLWRARNEAVFQGLEFSVARIIFNIDRFLTMLGTADLLLHEQVEGVGNSWISSLFTVRRPVRLQFQSVFWDPPSTGFKLNTDASVRDGIAAGGGSVQAL